MFNKRTMDDLVSNRGDCPECGYPLDDGPCQFCEVVEESARRQSEIERLRLEVEAAGDNVRKLIAANAEIERLTWERDDVAMMLRRVLRATESPLHCVANDLLQRLELQGSPLRDEAVKPEGDDE